jgi:hypothetical protein
MSNPETMVNTKTVLKIMHPGKNLQYFTIDSFCYTISIRIFLGAPGTGKSGNEVMNVLPTILRK